MWKFNMWYFERNFVIFRVKTLKELRLSENSLILLEIQFLWNKGGQKHSLSIDVRFPSIRPVFSFLYSLWNFLHSVKGELILCAGLVSSDMHFLYITGSAKVEPGIIIKIPQLWRLEWGYNGLKNYSKGLRDVEEGGISARKAAQIWGLSMKKSTLQVRLNGRVTFVPRKGSSTVFFKHKMKKKNLSQISELSLQTADLACPRMLSSNQWKCS